MYDLYSIHEWGGGGGNDVADQVSIYYFIPFSDPVLRWGVIFSDDLDLFLTSSAQPVLVGKETI